MSAVRSPTTASDPRNAHASPPTGPEMTYLVTHLIPRCPSRVALDVGTVARCELRLHHNGDHCAAVAGFWSATDNRVVAEQPHHRAARERTDDEHAAVTARTGGTR